MYFIKIHLDIKFQLYFIKIHLDIKFQLTFNKIYVAFHQILKF